MGHCLCWTLSVPDLTPPPAPVQSRHGLEAGFQNASRCRGPGCGAVGKAMLEGYCDKCYVKEQSARLNQVAHRTPHSPPLVMVGVCHSFLTPFPLLYFTFVMCHVSYPSFVCLSFSVIPAALQYPSYPQLPFSCQLTFLLFLFAPPLFLCTKSVIEQPNPDLRSNPRPRPRLSAGGVAAVMCPRVAQTSARSATRVARAERQAGGRRRPRKSPSSGAGRRAATTTPTKRNRATAMSVTTSNRFTAADHMRTHATMMMTHR